MTTLEIDDEDVAVLLRVRRQRELRELSLREIDPPIPPSVMGRVQATSQREAFHFSCVCDRQVVTRNRIGFCQCGREFDLSAWGV